MPQLMKRPAFEMTANEPPAKITWSVAAYDPSDDPRKDGDWTEIADHVSERKARAAVDTLRSSGYDRDLSITVTRHDPSKEPWEGIDVALPGEDYKS